MTKASVNKGVHCFTLQSVAPVLHKNYFQNNVDALPFTIPLNVHMHRHVHVETTMEDID